MVSFTDENTVPSGEQAHSNRKTVMAGATPHPAKKHRVERELLQVVEAKRNLAMMEDDGNDEAVMDGDDLSFANVTETQPAPSTTKNEDEIVEEEQEDDDDEEATQWKAFCEKYETDPESVPNLGKFLALQQVRVAANERLSQAMDECYQGFQASSESLNAQLVQLLEGNEVQGETKIQGLLCANHERRTSLAGTMDELNFSWNQRYNYIVGRLMDPNKKEEVGTSQENEEKQEDSKASDMQVDGESPPSAPEPAETLSPSSTGKDGEEEEQAEEEPDWQEMATAFPHAQPSIETFLEIRDERQRAQDALRNALEEFNASMEQTFCDIIQIAVNVHEQFNEQLIPMEAEIQRLMQSNCERRVLLAQQLQEQAERAQGMFASLMQRISKKVFSASPPAVGGAGNGA